jgi:hypothetical protein
MGKVARKHRPMIRFALVLMIAATASCGDAPATPLVTPITACPEGAVVVGTAPPQGLRQRCQKSETERHGASREWYENRDERSYSEWWEGTKHGRFTLWFKNGRVRSEGAHRHGVPAGKWRYFREDGSLRQQQIFPAQPPPSDWLAQALAGHPPPKEETVTAPVGVTSERP